MAYKLKPTAIGGGGGAVNRAKQLVFKAGLLALLFGGLASCGKKAEESLIIKMIPKESLVLEFNAYSCIQILNGIRTVDGGYATPDVSGPVVLFNKMSIQWTKDTKLYVHMLKIKFKGGGIAGGETTCDLTRDFPALFEYPINNPNDAYFEAGGFKEKGTIVSNPKCRLACSIPLADPEKPEIAATGEVLVKATEVTDEGTEKEKNFRVRSRFIVRVLP
jgi:hypothetical protein